MYSLNTFSGYITYNLDSFSGLKYSLDSRLDKGFFNFDSLVSFFFSDLKYSLDDQFDEGFFSLDNLVSLVSNFFQYFSSSSGSYFSSFFNRIISNSALSGECYKRSSTAAFSSEL